MKNLKRQPKSRRGASILLALTVFLLVALTGTAALTMAASNAGRYTHTRDDQRSYLAVASALSLVRGELEGFSVTAEFTYADTDGEQSLTCTSLTPAGSDLFGKMKSSLLENCKERMAVSLQSAYNEAGSTSAWKEVFTAEQKSAVFTLDPTVDETDGGAGIGTVSVRLTVAADGRLTFDFTNVGNETKYATRMTVGPIESGSVPDAGGTVYTQIFRWDAQNAQIEQVTGSGT